MKLNDAQLKYIHDGWNIPIENMCNLDAYRGWVNGYTGASSDYVEAVFLCDADGHVQYTFTTNGLLLGTDSLPFLSDENY